MNIMMLGDSGVGKTSFMTCSYGLMRQGIENFSIDSTTDEQREKFDRLIKNFMDNGTYPAATDKQSTYEFNFFNNDDYVMTFKWTDFKGGTVNYDDDDEDVKALKRGIKEADAVLLFIEAEKLLNDSDTQMEVMTLHYYLNQCASANNKALTIMPLFTKFDLAIEHTDDLDNLWKRLTEPFSELEKLSDLNDNITFAPMPIACAPHCMMHLDWVMLFLMVKGIVLHHLKDSEEIMTKYKRAESEWNEGSAIADFFGLSDKRDNARRIALELKPKVEMLEKMEKAYERLAEFLNGYEMWESYSVPTQKKEDIFNL